MSARQMIPGTAKEVAGFALACMSPKLDKTAAEANLARAERASMIRMGVLAHATSYAFPVRVGVHQVVVTTAFGPAYCEDGFPMASGLIVATARVSDKLASLIAMYVEGPSELWFDDDGDAFVSFASDRDATLFRLGLEG